MRELRPGLWHWEAPHPEWTPDEHWPKVVSSYAIDDGEHLVLFDPVTPPREIEELAAARKLVIVLTAPWHERDTRGLVERHGGAPVFTPLPDTADDLIEKFGISPERVEGWVSPDVRWLLEREAGEAHFYGAGEPLPAGIEAFPGREPNEVVLWVESHRAVVAGDTLADFGRGFEMPNEWLREGVTHEQVAEGLRPLLALPVEHVLATHGGPQDPAALERALQSS
jgi:glyoxylase-like metal-dependent hydrolase (beta-lactamase superfamily II)